MRLNKFLSHAGICSRRDADKLIESGRVSVNKKIMREPYILKKRDVVAVDGKVIQKKHQTNLWAYYKPVGEITTHNDPQKRKEVFESVRKKLKFPFSKHLVSVGRLDINSEGLLLITDSPELAHTLEKPSTDMPRKYRVRVFGRFPSKDFLEQLKNGISVEGISYAPILCSFNSAQKQEKPSNFWIEMVLTEGKNREIRRVLAAADLQVNRLIRVQYGNYEMPSFKVNGDIWKIHEEDVIS